MDSRNQSVMDATTGHVMRLSSPEAVNRCSFQPDERIHPRSRVIASFSLLPRLSFATVFKQPNFR